MDIRQCPSCKERVDIEDSIALAPHIEHRLCNWCCKPFNLHTHKEQVDCSLKYLSSTGHDVKIIKGDTVTQVVTPLN